MCRHGRMEAFQRASLCGALGSLTPGQPGPPADSEAPELCISCPVDGHPLLALCLMTSPWSHPGRCPWTLLFMVVSDWEEPCHCASVQFSCWVSQTAARSHHTLADRRGPSVGLARLLVSRQTPGSKSLTTSCPRALGPHVRVRRGTVSWVLWGPA